MSDIKFTSEYVSRKVRYEGYMNDETYKEDRAKRTKEMSWRETNAYRREIFELIAYRFFDVVYDKGLIPDTHIDGILDKISKEIDDEELTNIFSRIVWELVANGEVDSRLLKLETKDGKIVDVRKQLFEQTSFKDAFNLILRKYYIERTKKK